ANRVDHEIQPFQGNLADEDRAVVGDLHDIRCEVTSLNRQLDGPVDLERDEAGGGAGLARAERPQPQLGDQPLRHHQAGGAGVHQSVSHVDATNLVGWQQAALAVVKVL